MKYYKSEEFIEKIGGTFEDAKTTFNEYDKKARLKTVKLFLKKEDRGLLLDLGCGKGAWFSFLRSLGCDVVGVDLSKERLAIAHARGVETDLVCADGLYLPFQSGVFQAVTCIDVFVHVLEKKDQKAIMKEVSRVLKRKGILILSVPSRKKITLVRRLRRTVRKHYHQELEVVEPYCTFYSRKDVEKLTYPLRIEKSKGICFTYPIIARFVKILPLLDFFGKYITEYGHVMFFKLRKV